MLRNVCWHLPELELYSHVDQDAKAVVGFNPVVLQAVVKFYLMDPTISNEDVDPQKEYLPGDKNGYLFNVENNYNREYFHSIFRTMCSRRERMLRRPDVLAYQKLFCIRHPEQMHPMGWREQPWFLMKDRDFKGREHWDPEFKHVDYHNGPYIPRKFRPPKTNYYKYNPGAVKLWRGKGKIISTPIPKDENALIPKDK